MIRQYPGFFAALAVLVIALPAWTRTVWDLLLSESLSPVLGQAPWAARDLWPYVITVPSGSVLFGFLLIGLRRAPEAGPAERRQELRNGSLRKRTAPAAASIASDLARRQHAAEAQQWQARSEESLPDPAAWRRLELEFLKITDPAACMRARWQEQTGQPENWTIEDAFDHSAQSRFEALAGTAGGMLASSPEQAPRCSAGTLRISDPLHRWLSAVRERNIHAVRMRAGQLVGERDTVIGHTTTGLIYQLVRASGLLCQQLAVEEEGDA